MQLFSQTFIIFIVYATLWTIPKIHGSIYSEKMTCARQFIEALKIVLNWKQPTCPIMEE
jgi:hypothetical protein